MGMGGQGGGMQGAGMVSGKRAPTRSMSFQHFVDVSDMNCRANDADPFELESRRRLIERLNSIDPETARTEVLAKKQYKRSKTPLLLASWSRKRSASRDSGEDENGDVGFSLCLNLLHNLLADPEVASVFGKPVTELWLPESIPGYLEAIEHPMDLETVKRNLLRGTYAADHVTDIQAFADDMRLVFENAMHYNEEYNVYYQLARATMQKFDEAIACVPAVLARGGLVSETDDEDEDENETSGDEPSLKRAKYLSDEADGSTCHQTNCGVKKAFRVDHALENSFCSMRDDHRETQLDDKDDCTLSYEQKKRLGEAICRLSEAKLRRLIRLISVREGPAPVNTQDEIELDIDALGVETLREVQKFVRKCESGESTGSGLSELSTSSAEESNAGSDHVGSESESEEA